MKEKITFLLSLSNAIDFYLLKKKREQPEKEEKKVKKLSFRTNEEVAVKTIE
jgi:hypothetical protein